MQASAQRSIPAAAIRATWLLIATLIACLAAPPGLVPAATLDVDGDGSVSADTDGQLVLRYLFGFRGDELLGDALAPELSLSGAEIAAYLDAVGLGLDVDANGVADALSDGILILRYLRGDSAKSLIDGATGEGSVRDGDAIGEWIAGLVDQSTRSTGGDAYSPDANLRVAKFAVSAGEDGETPIVESQGAQATPVARSAVMDADSLEAGAWPRWLSQWTPQCVGRNGFCGFASALMGVDYLLRGATHPPAPLEPGYGGETSSWLQESVDRIFPGRDYTDCGGPVGIYPDDFSTFVQALGLPGDGAVRFQGLNHQADAWLRAALSADLPVLARVPYQGAKCSGRVGTQADWYRGGQLIREMALCSDLPFRHWVLVVGADPESVLVYDPDPHASSPAAGIRRYSATSFWQALPDPRSGYGVPGSPGNAGTSWLYKLCATPEACDYSPEAFTTVHTVRLGSNVLYAPDRAPPIASPKGSSVEFEATGLPAGLEMDPDGRIVGKTSLEGTFYPKIILRSMVSGIERVAELAIELIIEAGGTLQRALEFTTGEVLPSARQGAYYRLPIGTTPMGEPVVLDVASGELPIGLVLSNGAIQGVPEHQGTWSMELTASTSTASLRKTFELTVQPEGQEPPPSDAPVLTGIAQPATIYGQEGQQRIELAGTGFTEGMRVRLFDLTNGDGPYERPAEMLSPTSAAFRANFTRETAQWSATLIAASGQESNTIQFSVLASGANSRPAIWNNAWTTPLPNALPVTAEYGAFSRGCPDADLSNQYTWYLTSGTSQHLGLDLSAPVGTAVRAIGPGEVIEAAAIWGPEWRGVLLAEHWTDAGSFTVAYGHLDIDATLVNGQRIEAGTLLGTIADLSHLEPQYGEVGPHLHLGVAAGRRSSLPASVASRCVSSPGITLDPEAYLLSKNPRAQRPGATTPPGVPTGLSPGAPDSPGPAIVSVEVSLTWSPPADAVYYEIGVRDLTSNQLVVDQITTDTTLTTSLLGGRAYRWNLRACNLAGCSNYTAVHYFQTSGGSGVPSSPGEASPGSTTAPGPIVTSSAVSLTWSPVVGALFYDVGVRELGTGDLVVDETTGDTTLHVVLEPGKEYRWNVAACNALGCVGYHNTRRYFQTPHVADSTAFPLNDTGIDWCSDGNRNFLDCPVDWYPRQDAQDGRDATHNEDSDGHAGFSFTKLDANGNPLPSTATNWSCVRDNVTGLVWEVKTDDSGLRDKDWTYSWYNPDSATNGGSAGYADYGDNCYDASRCDIHKFVADVNAQGLCGAHDWRLPNVRELLSIVANDRFRRVIDTRYFPNTQPWGVVWSSSPSASYSDDAWYVSFYSGDVYPWAKYLGYSVRLVRGGQ